MAKPASKAVATKPEPEPVGETLPVPLAILRTQLEQRAAEFRMVLPAHISPEKLQRTILTAVQNSPVLLDCERRSFLTAAMKAAQDALLPDGREAAIVPFNHRYKDEDGWHTTRLAQYMPMVWGLRKKILQSGEITDLSASVVYTQEIEAGRFRYREGTDRALYHEPIVDVGFIPADEDIALVYSSAIYANGTISFEVMRRWEIDQIRESSQTGAAYDRNGNPREAKGPWVDWFGEMAKKSVIRRHSKSLPMSGDILADVEADDMAFAAKSAVALLGSHHPAPPEPTVGPEDTGFDPVTGEVVSDAPDPEPEETDELEERIQSHNELHPTPEPTQQPEAETHQAAPEAHQAAPEVHQPAEEEGLTDDSPQAVADYFIDRAGKCELLIDLRALEREADMTLATMPPDITGLVDEAFARARQRLTPAAAMQAPV